MGDSQVLGYCGWELELKSSITRYIQIIINKTLDATNHKKKYINEGHNNLRQLCNYGLRNNSRTENN